MYLVRWTFSGSAQVRRPIILAGVSEGARHGDSSGAKTRGGGGRGREGHANCMGAPGNVVVGRTRRFARYSAYRIRRRVVSWYFFCRSPALNSVRCAYDTTRWCCAVSFLDGGLRRECLIICLCVDDGGRVFRVFRLLGVTLFIRGLLYTPQRCGELSTIAGVSAHGPESYALPLLMRAAAPLPVCTAEGCWRSTACTEMPSEPQYNKRNKVENRK